MNRIEILEVNSLEEVPRDVIIEELILLSTYTILEIREYRSLIHLVIQEGETITTLNCTRVIKNQFQYIKIPS